jgi:hypothetical protein
VDSNGKGLLIDLLKKQKVVKENINQQFLTHKVHEQQRQDQRAFEVHRYNPQDQF